MFGQLPLIFRSKPFAHGKFRSATGRAAVARGEVLALAVPRPPFFLAGATFPCGGVAVLTDDGFSGFLVALDSLLGKDFGTCEAQLSSPITITKRHKVRSAAVNFRR